MSTLETGAGVLGQRLSAPAGGDAASTPDLPDYVVHTLARLRQLCGVPFQYLVPDVGLLPLESARFFTLDADWLDQLCLGALTVGAGGTREQAQAELSLDQVQAALGRQLPLVRDLERGRLVLEQALAQPLTELDPRAPVTGVVIRSALVSGWPGIQVRAYVTDDPATIPADVDPAALDPALSVPLLRMERLDPSTLIVLFAGVPALVWLEEPHHGIQFGLDRTAGGGWDVPLPDESGRQLPGQRVAVQLRPGSPDAAVVDVQGLADSLDRTRPLAHPRGSAALALALLRPPARQRFGASTRSPA